MAKQSLNTLKNWFKTGLKPLQVQFWHWMDSFWHKDEKIPAATIDGLQGLLDTKVDKKDAVDPDQVGVYDPAKNYVYDPLVAEYVSFSNPESPDPKFTVEGFYRLTENAPPGETPETHPAHWAYQGTVLGEITIDDVVGLREELDWLSENAGGGDAGLTPEQIIILESFRASFSLSGIDGFKQVFGRPVLIESIAKAANITELRLGVNEAVPSDITPQLPLTLTATDVLTCEATYDRESDSYFTLIGKKL